MKMQRILILIILIGAAKLAAAQSLVSTRQLRFYPVLTASDTTANNANRGRMWYDAVSQEFRFNSDGNNRSIGGGGSGGGGLNTASNALTATGSDVALGGPLTGNTTISGAFNLDFTNTATRFNSSNFQIWNPARTFKYTFAGGAITADRTITLPVISGNRNLMTVSNSSLNRIPYATNNSGDFVGSANFTFDGTTFTTPNVVSTGRGTFTTTATLAGINVGSNATDPSSLTNADLWVNSTSNLLKTYLNSTTRNVIVGSTGTVDNSILRADGTGTGLLQGSSLIVDDNGNLSTGNSSVALAGITIDVLSSSLNTSITLQSKGTGNAGIISPSGTASINSGGANAFINVNGTTNGLQITGAASLTTLSPRGDDDFIISGIAETSVNGKNITLKSGDTNGAGNLNSGNVIIEIGDPLGTGTPGDIILTPNGGDIKINDGANESMGTATLVAGTVTVNNSKITANTRIYYSVQTAGGTQGFLSTTRVAGTSFTITSTSATETSTVAWLLIEPN